MVRKLEVEIHLDEYNYAQALMVAVIIAKKLEIDYLEVDILIYDPGDLSLGVIDGMNIDISLVGEISYRIY